MPRTSIKAAFSIVDGEDTQVGFDLFVDGEWHERYAFRFQAESARRLLRYMVTINLHFRSDHTVVLYMGGKKCVDGDLKEMERIGQGLVDEGKARWGRTTFHKKGD